MSVWTFVLTEPLVQYAGTGKLHRPTCSELRKGSSFSKDYEWFDDGIIIATDDPYMPCCRRCIASTPDDEGKLFQTVSVEPFGNFPRGTRWVWREPDE